MDAYISPCDDGSVVCVEFPKDEFENTTFESAGFQVKVLSDRHDADNCVTPAPAVGLNGKPERYTDFLIHAESPSEMIGGVIFVHGIRDGVAAGNVGDDDIYRTFHNGRCFELRINRAYINTTDGPRDMSAAELKRLDHVLSAVLHSFRFTD